jgi:Predicted membrane protein
MSENVVKISDTWGNHGALGLSGLALASFMLAFSNLGLVEGSLVLVSMSIFVGGFIQVFAGLLAFKKGSTFDMVAFTMFGMFWISFAYILLAPSALTTNATGVGLYLFAWALLSGTMLLGLLKLKARVLSLLFIVLTIVFIVSGLTNFIAGLTFIAGILVLILALVSFYAAMAIVLNETGYKLPL